MTGDNIDDDEYVAKLLKQDAKNTAKKYEMVGLDAFQPQRSRNGAPKPNTNFLRHIIRQTDNHNAALLAKEAEDSRARLRRMNRERELEAGFNGDRQKQKERNTGLPGRVTASRASNEDGVDKKRKRMDHSDDDEERDDRRRRRHHHGASRDSRPRRERERDRESRREKKRHEESEDDSPKRGSRHSKRRHDDERRRKDNSDDDHRRSRRKDDPVRKHRRRRSSSKSTSRSRSPNSRPHRRHKDLSRRRNSRSPTSNTNDPDHRTTSTITNGAKPPKRRSPIPDSDSDPLEAILGPLPPRAQPAVRSRGRGARKADCNAMDTRFSTTYDPSTDVRVNSDVEDDWGDALEALKDRQRWQQQGAERLKAAGFSDEQVKKWEKGEEKTEEDVKWAKRGEGREWDRGKVVDEDGDVELKAEWGRLT